MRSSLDAIGDFLRLESTAGLLLVGTALLAIALANSPLAGVYEGLIDLPVAISVGSFALAKPLLLWINDGLMAIFFLLVGLEIKRELVEGELSSRDQVVLPACAALGGFALPALIYFTLNRSNPSALQGWAIPSATDIAFALGVLSLLGSRVPLALKVFLTTVAIIDDLLAIVVIAVFYTANLSALALALAGMGAAALLILNRAGVRSLTGYLLIGLVIWVCVLKSGVHATLAGVVVAAAIPLAEDHHGHSPARDLEHDLHPWVAYGIMPAFAFANAGVSFAGVSPASLLDGIPLGITLGLFLGKQLGVFGAAWLVIRLGAAALPAGTGWGALYGVALLSGIGFTMSLFIGTLAFEHGNFDYAALVRLGVLTGSVLSAVAGYLVLRWVLPKRHGPEAA